MKQKPILDEDDDYIRDLPLDPENKEYINKKSIDEIKPLSVFSNLDEFKPYSLDLKIQTSYEDFHLSTDQEKFWSEYVHSSII